MIKSFNKYKVILYYILYIFGLKSLKIKKKKIQWKINYFIFMAFFHEFTVNYLKCR